MNKSNGEHGKKLQEMYRANEQAKTLRSQIIREREAKARARARAELQSLLIGVLR